MKKIALIQPYFGNFPEYFPLHLLTISQNPQVTWIFFTDDRAEYPWPANCQVHYMSFSDMQKYISDKFDFPVSIKTPYKLCDYKPAYGYIFSEYLKGYDFWGHCDIDVIFGYLKKFLTDEILSQYDKIFSMGHMTLYRNTKLNNTRFMLPDRNGELFYKKVFSVSDKFLFDEVSNGRYNICTLWADYGFSVYNDSKNIADIAQKSSYFQLTKHHISKDARSVRFEKTPQKHHIFWWNKGHLYLGYLQDGQYHCDEFLYMHLIRRTKKMAINMPCNSELYKIIPHEFVTMKEPLSAKNYSKENGGI